MKTITYAEALREAMAEEMRRDSGVLLMGEDIGAYGGAFGVTRGLLREFGPQRVMDTPISEGGFVGVAIGAALGGCRPVVELMFMDFVTLTVDALVNQAAKLHYVFGPDARCPLVVRAVGGAGRCYGPTHSQSLEAWFLHAPGLKVVAPATAADAKGMLKTAIRDPNPVLFVEHKLLYGRDGGVPQDADVTVPFGQARLARPGQDLTLIAWSGMTPVAEQAAEELARQGVSAEVLDLRSLNPMDMTALRESASRTGRVLIAQEGCRSGGVAAEISARLAESVYDYLDAPITRVATPDIPIPASPVLERAALPDRDRIVQAALRLTGNRAGKT